MSKSTVNLSNVDLDSLTVDNFRTVTGRRLRTFGDLAAKAIAGEITRDEARQQTLDRMINAFREANTQEPQVAVVEPASE